MCDANEYAKRIIEDLTDEQFINLMRGTLSALKRGGSAVGFVAPARNSGEGKQ